MTRTLVLGQVVPLKITETMPVDEGGSAETVPRTSASEPVAGVAMVSGTFGGSELIAVWRLDGA